MVTKVTATYAEMCTWQNLYAAYRNAARGKRGRPWNGSGYKMEGSPGLVTAAR